MSSKLAAPAMVYVKGEEMTRYVMQIILDQWIAPHVDTSAWQYFDLSVKHRDDTNDKVLADVIAAGRDVKAIFKEPTITPTGEQKAAMGLKNTLGSPNGKMRAGWNGFAISRDTILIEGVELGYKKPVLFDRHAVGGEYSAGYKEVGPGTLKMVFTPADGGAEIVVDERKLTDKRNAAVAYHNPYDNVEQLGHHFFTRCLEAGVKPYIVTKKTVFKWQEPFWEIMQKVFNAGYAKKFADKGILKADEKLSHLISDDATMRLIRWTEGNFGMVAHNYDGDMLTDEMSQVHRSPGFITSVLCGVTNDGTPIREFEASHGTIADQDAARLAGKETSVNPLGLVAALTGAMDHSAKLAGGAVEKEMMRFTNAIMQSIYAAFRDGKGTRDLSGPKGLTTEQFVDEISKRMGQALGKAAA